MPVPWNLDKVANLFFLASPEGVVRFDTNPSPDWLSGERLRSEVKRRIFWLVVGWGTAWEHLRVLSAFVFVGVYW